VEAAVRVRPEHDWPVNYAEHERLHGHRDHAAGFTGLTDNAELWIAFQSARSAEVGGQSRQPRLFGGGAVEARRQPGSGAERDGRHCASLEAAYPQTNEKRGVEVSPLDVELVGGLRPALLC
jgi:hypothetical protein